MKSCLAWSTLLLMLLGAVPARADEPELSLRLTPLGRARPRAPVWVQVELQSRRPGVLAGRLDLRAMEGLEELWALTTEEIVLAGGVQRQTLILPPVVSTLGAEPVELLATFHSGRAGIALGRHPLLLADDDQRSLHLGLADPYAGSARKHEALLAALDLERFDPDPKRSRLRVLRSHLPPPALPEAASGLVGFDVLALLDEGLAELEEQQLTAIVTWVRAGGAVLVRLGVALEVRHLDFLRALLGNYPEQTLEREAGGRLAPPDPPWRDGLGCFRCGLGRVVVVAEGAAPDPEATSWRWATAFLWRLRASQWASVRKRGVWDVARDKTPENLRREIHTVSPEDAGRPYVDARPLPLQVGEGLQALLLPERIEMVSIWTLSAILLVYILVIGPGDYILLGRLRRRWLTWISFPLWSVLAMLLTMAIVRSKLGANDHLGRIIIRDVDARGRALRELQLELHFLAHPQTLRRELQDAWLIPMGQDLGASGYSRGGWREHQAISLGWAHWDGRLPRRYGMRQEIGQWSPQLNRTLELAPQGPGLGLDWSVARGVGPQRPWRAPGTAGVPEDQRGRIYVGYFHDEDSRSDRVELSLYDFLGGHRDGRRQEAALLAERLCRHRHEGLFTVLAQVAPRAAPDIEDFAVMDGDDAQQSLVVAGLRVGNDYIFERRLFVTGPKGDK